MRGKRRTGSSWAGHADVCVNEALAARGDDRRLGRIYVVASGKCATACGQACLIGKFLDQESRGSHCACSGCGCGFVELDAFGGV